jgi:hypothetical protein
MLTNKKYIGPQPIQYVPTCKGAKDKPCLKGLNPGGDICTSCKGTGIEMLCQHLIDLEHMNCMLCGKKL